SFFTRSSGNIYPTTTTDNVGIGTASPSKKLHVSGDSLVTGYTYINDTARYFTAGGSGVKLQTAHGYIQFGPDNASWAHIHTDRGSFYFNKTITVDQGLVQSYNENLSLNASSTTSADIIFKSGGTERMRMTSDGSVGIGITNPTSNLHVAGSTSGASVLKADGTSGTVFEVTDDLSDSLMSVNTIAGLPVFEVFADNHIVAGRYGQNDFYLNTDGNLGLGTSAPSSVLDIYEQSGKDNKLRFHNDTTGSGTSNGSRIGLNGAELFINNIENAAIKIYTQSTQTNGITILGNGNVGIGTTLPDAKLTIKDPTNPPQIRLEDVDGGTQTAKIVFDQSGQNSLVLSTQYQSSTDLNLIQFAPADNVAMTIRGGTGTSDGFVGIGTASPAYLLSLDGDANDLTKGLLHVEHSGSYIGTSQIQQMVRLVGKSNTENSGNTPSAGVSLDFYNRWTGNAAYSVARIVGRASQGYNGGLQIDVGNNSGNGQSGFSTAMTILADRNVGIGTTSPNSRLDVRSTSAFTNGVAYVEQGLATNLPTLLVNQTVSGGNANVDQGLVVKAVGTSDGSGNTLHAYQRDGSTTGLVVKGSGKVGIGTVTPGELLEVDGNIRLGDGGERDIIGPTNESLRILANPNASTEGIKFSTDGGTTTEMFIQDGGNVGIGTTNPNLYKLQVVGPIYSSEYYATNTSSSFQKLSVYGDGGTYGIGMVSGITYGALNDWAMTFRFNSENDRGFWWGDTSHSTAQGAMALTTNGYLTVANRMKVGGGESDTTGPSHTLDVNGTVAINDHWEIYHDSTSDDLVFNFIG
ncbi:hypothetical protein OAG43_04410, partial [Verrucomicrobia bacterium]|nr:hypothetical protein [Verrucomicrobiota bacterium]